tara:strand:- start:398 stop:580 length:183 start_codon:yes stop_codon:yes gene_type:complete
MTDLEKLEYVHSTLQEIQTYLNLYRDDMVSQSLAFLEDLREPYLQAQPKRLVCDNSMMME